MPRLTAQERLWRSMPEAELQETFRQLAEVMGWPYFHEPDSRMSPAGLPDTIIVAGGKCWFLELKTEHGKLRTKQMEWGTALMEVEGVEYRLVRPSTMDAVVAQIMQAARRRAG